MVDVIDELPRKVATLEKLHCRKRRKTSSYLFLVASKISSCAKFSAT
jgi:hypothetical protein